MIKPSGLTVSAAPHLHNGSSVQGRMTLQILALIPATLAGLYFFGAPAAITILLSIATAVVSELGMQKALKRETTVADGSAVLTGLLFALLLPAGTPWWVVIIGSALCMVLGKWIFGGLGAYPFNPVLVGFMMVKISWPAAISIWPKPAPLGMTNALPVETGAEILKRYGVAMADQLSTVDMLIGNQAGGIGAVSGIALLAGGIFLVARGVFKWHIPAAFIAGVLLVGGIFRIMDPAEFACPFFHLLAGSTLLGVFFLAPEYTTSPNTKWGKLLYGFGCGALVIIIRIYGKYPDGVAFAILLMNMFTPLFDRIRPPIAGVAREAQADG